MIHSLKQTGLILLLLLCSNAMLAQKTYTLYGATDLTLAGLGLTTGITGLVVGNQVKPLSPTAIMALDRRDVFQIDRQETYWHSSKAGHASDIFMVAGEAAPFILLASASVRKEADVISLMYVETMMLSAGITLLTKNIVLRTRPFVYNPNAMNYNKQGTDARKSFFSGHTAGSAAGCFFAAKVWSDLHPDSAWKPLVWTVASSFPAVTGFLRMRAGKHFFTDVTTGYVVGAALGWLVPTLHKSKRFQKTGLHLYGSPNGAGLVWQAAI